MLLVKPGDAGNWLRWLSSPGLDLPRNSAASLVAHLAARCCAEAGELAACEEEQAATWGRSLTRKTFYHRLS